MPPFGINVFRQFAQTENGTISVGKLKSSVQFMALGNAPIQGMSSRISFKHAF
jgi:hypothetical protein